MSVGAFVGATVGDPVGAAVGALVIFSAHHVHLSSWPLEKYPSVPAL